MDYYSLSAVQFWLFFALFFAATFFSFYVPSYVVLRHAKLLAKSSFVLTSILGIVMWGIQGYVFGYLEMRWLTYVYLLIFLILALKDRKLFKEIHIENVGKVIASNKLIVFLLLFGVFVQLVPVFGSGLLYKDGVKFFGVNAYDGIMHLSYIKSIVMLFPPIEPGAYPNLITNYHYWTDLVLADLARIWRFPIANMFFQYFPLYISLVTGLIAVHLIKVLRGSKEMTIWFLFLLYFAGDGAYLFMLLLHKTFGFYTPAIDNGATQFLNMPHAVAKPIFMSGLIFFYFWLKDRLKFSGVLAMISFATLFGFKVYFGIYMAIGIALLFTTEFLLALWKKREKGILIGIPKTITEKSFLFTLTAIFVVISLLIYLPPNSNSGGLFFAPLEWPKIFLNEYNLNLREWWLRRQVYIVENSELYLVIFDIAAVIVTLISVYGTRIIGFVITKPMCRWLGYQLVILLIPGLFVFQFLGLFTLQESGGFNVFNFFAVSAFILSLFSAFTLAEMTKKKNMIARIFLFIFVILTLPRVMYEVYNYTFSPRLRDMTNLVSNEELKALEFIKVTSPDDAMLQAHPNNPLDRSSPYVSFFTNRFTYLSGVTLQETHNQNTGHREEEIKKMFEKETEDDFDSEMRKKHIYYIYQQKVIDQKFRFPITERYTNNVYENEEVRIIRLKDQYWGE